MRRQPAGSPHHPGKQKGSWTPSCTPSQTPTVQSGRALPGAGGSSSVQKGPAGEPQESIPAVTPGGFWTLQAGRRQGQVRGCCWHSSVYFPYHIAQCYKLLVSVFPLAVQCTRGALHSTEPAGQSHTEFDSVAGQLFLQSSPYPLLGFWLVSGFGCLKFSIHQLPSSHISYKSRDNLLATSICLIIITARSKLPASKPVIAQ